MVTIARNKKNKDPKPKIGKRVVKSDFEFKVYKNLLNITPRGSTIEYELEKLEYTETKQYTPDFIIHYMDGRKVYIESKGFFPYNERAKMIAVKAQHPDLDIRLVFYRDNPGQLGRGSKTKPSEWATKNGFPFAVGEVPKEWFS